jgi:hypothetical protein
VSKKDPEIAEDPLIVRDRSVDSVAVSETVTEGLTALDRVIDPTDERDIVGRRVCAPESVDE